MTTKTLRNFWTLSAILAGLCASYAVLGAPPDTKAADAQHFFEARIRPLLHDKCLACHGEKQQMGGLRLDSRSALLKGGGSGAAVVPKDTTKSLLLQAVQHSGKLKMPPSGKLTPAQIADLTAWVAQGAVWQETASVPKADPKRFWSFQPLRATTPPKTKTPQWVKNGIDAFILAKLEAKGLKPAPSADRRTLLRRVAFDLTGLPPTPQEISDFLADKSPNAYAKVLDRLLASPQYGERWARHWLDVVRYADSWDARGLGSEGDISEAWRYRDWVVNALNQDMPYTLFVQNQIAGDLLPAPVAGDINVQGTIATGMLALGNWGNGDADKDKILTDIADDQVDVISRGVMGVTLACARCHDHKFDPFTAKDYYALAGIFFSSHILPKLTPKGAGEVPLRIPLETRADKERRTQYSTRLASLETQTKEIRGKAAEALAQSLMPQTIPYMVAVWEYRNRPASEANVTLEAFAKQKGLHAFALRQWQNTLGMGDNYLALSNPVRNLLENKNVLGVSATGGNPSATVNLNTEAQSILTYTLPPKSVSVHPGPKNAVLAEWRSPISGTVQLSGSVIDSDPACGNGVLWQLDHQSLAGTRTLAFGDVANAGGQDLAVGKSFADLSRVEVQFGDRLQLIVLPKGEYSCDTTTLELEITASDGKTWNLTQDAMQAFSKPMPPNPFADHYGTAEVWRFADAGATPRPPNNTDLPPALKAWSEAVQQSRNATNARVVITQAAEAFQKSFAPPLPQNPFYVSRREDEENLPAETRTQLAQLYTELETLRKTPPSPVMFAHGAQEGGSPESPHAGTHDVRIHLRGRYDRLGEVAPRGFPALITYSPPPPIPEKESGRLQLAQWLTRAEHPLTARVLVNRIWNHHFGQGIVRTPNNFGLLGERPTHPELLDWLANQFIKQGWSLKQLHKLILLSATYQQSSVAAPEAIAKDPDNRLFGRMNRRRLEAEAIRDNLLASSGKIDLKMGGVATRDISVPRRTLYLMTVRSERTGFTPLFDGADSTGVMEKRTISTVAPQSLYMLNSGFVAEQVGFLLERLEKESPKEMAARIAWLYRLLYGREATPKELQIGQKYLAVAGDKSAKETVWREYLQILVCANEFLYTD